MRLLIIKISMIFFIMPLASFGQNRNVPDSSIDQLAQFEYMVGNWQVNMNIRQDDGTFKAIEDTAKVKAFYHHDGRTFQSIFTMENGFYSTDLRTYNVVENEWQIMFLNAKAQRWHKFSASVEEGTMTTIIPGGYSGKEDFDIKVLDLEISDNSFVKHVYQSNDSGQSWVHLYIMNYSKQTNN
ncbi:MAG: hypothetical protein HOH19_10455 [Kordiimonadaceae bacterium]|nr:hypothetical protein [Kordiimonadaceae bacterium]MBT6032987.1 hypothetical protein [Kordiimonadaceae bacterium]